MRQPLFYFMHMSQINPPLFATSLSVSAVRMAELLSIKRELKVIKVQIDGLLDCVDKMDRQRKDGSGRENNNNKIES